MRVAKSAEKVQLELGTHRTQRHRKLHVTVFAPKVMAKSIIYPEQLNFQIQSLLSATDSQQLQTAFDKVSSCYSLYCIS